MALILLICCHFFSGYGLLRLFRMRHGPLVVFPLSLLLGVAIASVIPFILQLLYCPLYPVTVFGALGLVCLLMNVRGLRRPIVSGRELVRKARTVFSGIRIRVYELPVVLLLTFIVFVSVWRCYYLPPTSRDALSGPEAIAEYAVREHSFVNSFFTTDLSTTNNQFKSPFLISLQVVYKMAGFPFGQLWLSVIFVSFTLLLYQLLKVRLHPILAGLLLLLLTVTPELYAYSFMILYDYSNMVFFFLSLYFLIEGSEDGGDSCFYFSALLMGIATYIRSETLVLAVLFLPMIWVMQLRRREPLRNMVMHTCLFVLPSLVGYFLTIRLYIGHYLPVHYDISALVNPHPFALRPLFRLYRDIVIELMAGEYGLRLWGFIMYVWAAFFLAELVVLRGFCKAGRNWLYAIGAVFIGLGLLGFLLPLFDLEHTTKRGLFKILPLMVLYLANNQLLVRLSARIRKWEEGRPVGAGEQGGTVGDGNE